MRPDRRKLGTDPLPLALAAVTVAGQCRERSPADLAVFGPQAARFADRFVDRATGEAMLAEAVRDGAAERRAELHAGSGDAPFRVALWRQRGGERIRLLASFVHLPDGPAESVDGGAIPALRVETFGEQLRLPLAAVAGFAERLRHDGTGSAENGCLQVAGDILAATWRMMRLVDDLVLLAELGAQAPPLRMSEVDVTRLARRVLRLAQPLASTADVGLVHELGSGVGPSVLADETTLWSVIENLVRAGVEAGGRGGEVRISCRSEAGDLVLWVESRGGATAPPRLSLRATEEMARANGAQLRLMLEGGFAARLTFPKERCLGPV